MEETWELAVVSKKKENGILPLEQSPMNRKGRWTWSPVHTRLRYQCVGSAFVFLVLSKYPPKVISFPFWNVTWENGNSPDGDLILIAIFFFSIFSLIVFCLRTLNEPNEIIEKEDELSDLLSRVLSRDKYVTDRLDKIVFHGKMMSEDRGGEDWGVLQWNEKHLTRFRINVEEIREIYKKFETLAFGVEEFIRKSTFDKDQHDGNAQLIALADERKYIQFLASKFTFEDKKISQYHSDILEVAKEIKAFTDDLDNRLGNAYGSYLMLSKTILAQLLEESEAIKKSFSPEHLDVRKNLQSILAEIKASSKRFVLERWLGSWLPVMISVSLLLFGLFFVFSDLFLSVLPA